MRAIARVPCGVFQPVIRFVFDRVTGGFLIEILIKATALNHKAINDAVKKGAVVKTIANVLLEVGGGNGGFFMIKRNRDVTVVRL